MRRAVLYLRLSESDDTSTSIARQEADLRARAEREGWHVVATLTDDGISGRKARTNAEHALAMITNGQADVLMVWKFDRWSRQGLTALADLINVLEDRRDALFIADQDGLNSDQPAWRIVAAVLAEAAKIESDNTRLRVKSSHTALKQAHRFAGGAVPYGYRPAPSPGGPGRILVLEAHEVTQTNEWAQQILADGSTWRIARQLNDLGVPSPQSEFRRLARQGKATHNANIGKWSSSAVRTILTGHAVVGRYKLDGELLRDGDGLPLEVWPAAVPREFWNMVKAKLAAGERGPTKRRPRRARLLSGILKCGECGGSTHVWTPTGRARQSAQQAYRCSSHVNGGVCLGIRISAPKVEDHVVGEMLSAVGGWPVIRCVEAVADDAVGELAEIEEAIRKTTIELAADNANVLALVARLDKLKAQRFEVRSHPSRSETRHLPTGQVFQEAWNATEDMDERRSLLEGVVDTVHVMRSAVGRRFDPDRIKIEWKREGVVLA